MKKIALIIVLPMFLLSVGSLFIYNFVDINSYKPAIVKAIKENTKKDVNIAGDIKLRLFPSIALSIFDVALKSQNELDPDTITIEKMIVELKILPLFRKNFEIASLKLVKPSIRFFNEESVVNSGSLQNEKQLPKDSDKNNEVIKDVTAEQDLQKTINQEIIGKFKFEEILIEDGKIIFVDEKSKKALFVLDNIDLNTSVMPGENKLNFSSHIKADNSVDIPLSISGKYSLLRNNYKISDLEIQFGETQAHGDVDLDFRNSTSDIKVALYFYELNFNPYFQLVNALSSQKNEEGIEPEAVSKEKKPTSYEYAWDKTFIDRELLRRVNGRFNFKANKIVYQDVNLGTVEINSYLTNDKLAINIKKAEVFGGTITGDSSLDVVADTIKLRSKYNIAGIDIAQLPEAIGLKRKISGNIDGNVSLFARGLSEKDFIESLAGDVNFSITNGYIKGIDLVAMAKNITTAFLPSNRDDRQTDFDEFSADVIIDKGVLRTDNLVFTSKILDFAGSGVASLPDLSVNFRMIPKIKNVKDEQDVLGGMRVPIMITGNLLNPTYSLEVQTLVGDMIKNPKGTENLVKQLKNDFKGIKNKIKEGSASGGDGVVKDLKNILQGF